MEKEINIKYTVKNVSYNDAVKNTPKGFKMVDIVDVALMVRDNSLKNFPFYFWIENPKWNKISWRPVAYGANRGGNFSINSNNTRKISHKICRGVYVKLK